MIFTGSIKAILMKDLFSRNIWFLIPYIIFLIICSGLLLSFPKAELHILLNKANAPFFDVFFKYATHLGDGTIIAILGVVFLFVKYRYLFAFLIGSLSAALVVNLFKKVILDEMYRPAKYFELFETYKLHLVEGVNQHSLQSFPSGHTASAFSVFFMLALVTKNKWGKLLLLFAAVVVAYSRVYISQHFVVDITAGSIISVILLFFSFFWVENWKKSWLDNSVLTHTKSSK
jgi:membrane-associated phospholipid phosphatase